MKLNFEQIIRNLEAKANTIYVDTDRIKELLEKTKKKVEENKILKDAFEDIKLFIDLLKDWMKGDYKDISKGSIIMIIISLIYLVNPIDIVPDFLVAGFIDDLAVIGYIIKKISGELDIYKKWKKEKNEEVITFSKDFSQEDEKQGENNVIFVDDILD